MKLEILKCREILFLIFIVTFYYCMHYARALLDNILTKFIEDYTII